MTQAPGVKLMRNWFLSNARPVSGALSASTNKESVMPKPTVVKLTGLFEMPDTMSLKELQRVITDCQAVLEQGIGPGVLVLKLGRQELRA